MASVVWAFSVFADWMCGFAVQPGMVGSGVGKGFSGLGGGRGSGWKLVGNGSVSVSMGVLFIVFTLGCGWGYGELH